MRVFIECIPKRMSVAIQRVQKALAVTAPEGVQLVSQPEAADVQILHAVDAKQPLRYLRAPQYAVIQYSALASSDGERNVPLEDPAAAWGPLWDGALAIWSYYDLAPLMSESARARLYLEPLGVEGQIFRPDPVVERDLMLMTSGSVSGPMAEPIEDCALAAADLGGRILHLGPDQIRGMYLKPPSWQNVQGISDSELAELYRRTRWVSAMRYVEGFEFSAIEGLACGARPICFDRPDMRRWYEGLASFVPESMGEELQGHLRRLLAQQPAPVTEEERQALLARFNWEWLAGGFWAALLGSAQAAAASEPPKAAFAIQRPPRQRRRPSRRLLWIGDSPTLATGFGRVAYYALEALRSKWDVTVVGTNFDGAPYDPARHPYEVFPASSLQYPGDVFGLARISQLVNRLKPDLCIVQQDPWNVARYLPRLGDATTVGIVPVAGRNCRGAELNGLAGCIFWTPGQLEEARRGGYLGPAEVIPLGVDLGIYKPIDRYVARTMMGWPERLRDAYVVGWVARNHPQKRLDLMLRYFALWVRKTNNGEAHLYLHVGPTGDIGYDISSLAQYYQIANRLIIAEPPIDVGLPEHRMALTYNTFDALACSSQGEGWNLPALEAMACGIPTLLPNFMALSEWPREAAVLCSTSGTYAQPGAGGACICQPPDEATFVEGLEELYRNPQLRVRLSELGRALAARPEYRWGNISQRIVEACIQFMSPVSIPTSPDPEATLEVAVG